MNIPAKEHSGTAAQYVDAGTLLLDQRCALGGEAMPLSPCCRGLDSTPVVHLDLKLGHAWYIGEKISFLIKKKKLSELELEAVWGLKEVYIHTMTMTISKAKKG